ncbi:nucleotidyltransferase domain-containing protein [Rhodomicrobium vannielii ATCC 17100]|uniref:nucleotidyltransferase family protein n=1 Tax=Rhodomicrobium vannielii TaxID=1069 RepID=UPI00191A3B15|nr:nucleotidyltransferase domain-containing protein [Rhodomicrobium vannielii]MBJ7532958.1 nucleotidyltransferase domain-containing protein [Rhodomicrobium vannielii ATCC 17100]
MADLDIRPQDLATVHAILGATLPATARIWAFGSRAARKARRGSDLDLAVDVGRELTQDEEVALAVAFEESDLPYTVDIVDLHSVSESFRHIIKQTAQPLV